MMYRDPVLDELHRHREEMFRECDNDPETFLRYLQDKERSSGRPVEAPPAERPKPSPAHR